MRFKMGRGICVAVWAVAATVPLVGAPSQTLEPSTLADTAKAMLAPLAGQSLTGCYHWKKKDCYATEEAGRGFWEGDVLAIKTASGALRFRPRTGGGLELKTMLWEPALPLVSATSDELVFVRGPNEVRVKSANGRFDMQYYTHSYRGDGDGRSRVFGYALQAANAMQASDSARLATSVDASEAGSPTGVALQSAGHATPIQTPPTALPSEKMTGTPTSQSPPQSLRDAWGIYADLVGHTWETKGTHTGFGMAKLRQRYTYSWIEPGISLKVVTTYPDDDYKPFEHVYTLDKTTGRIAGLEPDGSISLGGTTAGDGVTRTYALDEMTFETTVGQRKSNGQVKSLTRNRYTRTDAIASQQASSSGGGFGGFLKGALAGAVGMASGSSPDTVVASAIAGAVAGGALGASGEDPDMIATAAATGSAQGTREVAEETAELRMIADEASGASRAGSSSSTSAGRGRSDQPGGDSEEVSAKDAGSQMVEKTTRAVFIQAMMYDSNKHTRNPMCYSQVVEVRFKERADRSKMDSTDLAPVLDAKLAQFAAACAAHGELSDKAWWQAEGYTSFGPKTPHFPDDVVVSVR